ncbi:MAG: G-protein coupled receptor [Bacteroidetes bacterium]|nr:G-protein coupled receptor [Bacteroidota bacterium]
MSSTTNVIIIIQHTLTSIIGIIGNVLVLIVYKKKLKDNETITFFIVHLALTDLACCLFLIPINLYHELFIGAISSDFMCKFHSFLNIINITYSCLLMTLVAFERYFSIVYPFRKIVTKLRAKICMSILFGFCFGMALTSCLGIGIYHKVHRVYAKQPVGFPLNLNDNQTSLLNGYFFEEEGEEGSLINTSQTVEQLFSTNPLIKRMAAENENSLKPFHQRSTRYNLSKFNYLFYVKWILLS